ncbi:MAG TPA: hypothetical protein VFQ84_13325 [Arenimonas sp.]|uniref:hypothetical protein n=1 Tax=Arenimonas sp. TaxID=1872635 RepID=UPI002D7F30FC|nr:hypothetical protein [Arenimonas sp.]HEU0154313.1 hypothetical protein [Arenimonas sp.]
MSPALLLPALLAATPLAAQDVLPAHEHPHEILFRNASELVPWCRNQAEAYFVGQGEDVYQWTASHFSRGRNLHVEGKLRAGGRDVAVSCRVARGASDTYASIEITPSP